MITVILSEKTIKGSNGDIVGTSSIQTDDETIQSEFDKSSEANKEDMLKKFGYSNSDITKIKEKIDLA